MIDPFRPITNFYVLTSLLILAVYNACSCLPVSLPAAQRLLSKTLCADSVEPNNNVRGKKSVSQSPATVTTVTTDTVDMETVAKDAKADTCKSAPSSTPPVQAEGQGTSGGHNSAWPPLLHNRSRDATLHGHQCCTVNQGI